MPRYVTTTFRGDPCVLDTSRTIGEVVALCGTNGHATKVAHALNQVDLLAGEEIYGKPLDEDTIWALNGQVIEGIGMDVGKASIFIKTPAGEPGIVLTVEVEDDHGNLSDVVAKVSRYDKEDG